MAKKDRAPDPVSAYIAAAVKAKGSEADIAREAEKLAGKNNIEFHPLLCDAVLAAFPYDGKVRKCPHVSGAKRAAAEAEA